MNNRLYLGIDTGINSTGLIALNDKFRVVHAENFAAPKHLETRKAKGNFMLDSFFGFLEMVGKDICGCFLEDHILKKISRKSTSIFDINRLDGRFEQELYRFKIPYSYIRIDHIKWMVDCHTRSPKGDIAKGVKSKWNEDFYSFGKDHYDDMADAYILARMLRLIRDFKKGPREFTKKYEYVGDILKDYSAFFKFKEV